MAILRFCLLRLLQLIPVLLGITIIAFLLLRVMPGDPATLMLGSRGTAEEIAKLNAQLGLDKPLWMQYFHFLTDAIQGNFGQSIAYKTAVGPLILEKLWPTLSLVAYSTVLAIIMTVPLSLISAIRRGKMIDNGIKLFFVVMMSMPAFWLGILLIILFSVTWQIFPVSGYGDNFIDRLYHLFLPSLVIALGTAAMTIRTMRSSVIAVLRSDYIDTALSKGLSYPKVIAKHVLRNSMLSTISVLGVHTSWVIGGTVIIEAVFAIPGLGSLLVSSIGARDYSMVQGLTITFAVLVVLINMITDIAYVVANPRMKLS